MKVKTLLLIALVALMCSCSDDVLNEGSRYSAQPVPRVTFSFDSITAPNVWAQYQSLEEMLAACQIPEEKLNSMSTDELIDVCMSHPLHSLYFAYNNEMVGAKVVFEHFNGFSELKKRKDAPTKMLEFYDDINFNAATPKVHRENFSKITYMGFIELYLASKELTSLYEGENLEKLELVSNKVLEKKLEDPSIYTVRRSLLINSQVKLAQGTLSKEETDALKSFISVGGNVDNPQEYTRISAIVSK